MKNLIAILGSFLLLAPAQDVVRGQQKVSTTAGGFGGTLKTNVRFGRGIASLGDLDLDGVPDIAVSQHTDNDGGLGRGACWIVFQDATGAVRAQQKISDTAGGFLGVLRNGDSFGFSVAGIGDLDGDGVPDIIAGAPDDNDGGLDRGAVWVLFLNQDGTVRAFQKISQTKGGFVGSLVNGDHFGQSVASLGDLDGDGLPEIAVGAHGNDDGAPDAGGLWIIFLRADGTVRRTQEVASLLGGFTGQLDASDRFGFTMAWLGGGQLAVGADQDDDGGSNHGAAWILSLDALGLVQGQAKISSTSGGFTGALDVEDRFASSLAAPGDLDGDGIGDLSAGATLDDDGGLDRGAVWILYLNRDSTVKASAKISSTQGGFTGTLDDDDRFGVAVSPVGDLDGDGRQELGVGASRDDDGGSNFGSYYVLFL